MWNKLDFQGDFTFVYIIFALCSLTARDSYILEHQQRNKPHSKSSIIIIIDLAFKESKKYYCTIGGKYYHHMYANFTLLTGLSDPQIEAN